MQSSELPHQIERELGDMHEVGEGKQSLSNIRDVYTRMKSKVLTNETEVHTENLLTIFYGMVNPSYTTHEEM